MGEVLVVTSGKGGTGKTTLCAGLASCLAAMGQRVLAIDCDIGLSNLDIALGMTDCATVSFLDVMMENQYLSDAPEHPVIPGLQLLTAPSKTRAGLVDDIIFGRLIEEAAETYDWVLLDAPAGIGFGFDLAAAYATGPSLFPHRTLRPCATGSIPRRCWWRRGFPPLSWWSIGFPGICWAPCAPMWTTSWTPLVCRCWG